MARREVAAIFEQEFIFLEDSNMDEWAPYNGYKILPLEIGPLPLSERFLFIVRMSLVSGVSKGIHHISLVHLANHTWYMRMPELSKWEFTMQSCNCCNLCWRQAILAILGLHSYIVVMRRSGKRGYGKLLKYLILRCVLLADIISTRTVLHVGTWTLVRTRRLPSMITLNYSPYTTIMQSSIHISAAHLYFIRIAKKKYY